jgi:hypothetical protein
MRARRANATNLALELCKFGFQQAQMLLCSLVLLCPVDLGLDFRDLLEHGHPGPRELGLRVDEPSPRAQVVGGIQAIQIKCCCNESRLIAVLRRKQTKQEQLLTCVKQQQFGAPQCVHFVVESGLFRNNAAARLARPEGAARAGATSAFRCFSQFLRRTWIKLLASPRSTW